MPLICQKKCQGEDWENVGILKYLLKPRPGFILTSHTIFDALVKKKCINNNHNNSRYTAP